MYVVPPSSASTTASAQQYISPPPARQLAPEQRLRLALAALAGEPVSLLARQYSVSRQFVSQGYLELLRFFLNHRRFMRSEHEERVGKSPAELLTGEKHGHWLEMLGYQPFRRSA